MKGLLWVMTLFALAVGVSLAAHFNEGYLLIVLPSYRAEITLNLAILVVLGIFAILYAILRTFAVTFSLPGRVREFRARRRREKASKEFYDVARLIFEGRYTQAMKKAIATHATGQTPALAALLAAHSAQHLREPDRQKAWLEQAARDDPKMQCACLMLEAEMHVEMHRFDEAIAVLKRLQDKAGRHIAALRLELRAHQGAGNWNDVLRIARLLEKRNALMPEAAQEIKLKAHQENIRQCHSDLSQLLAYQKKLPAHERSPRLSLAYAKALMNLGAEDEAQRFIESQLETGEWDPRLVDMYGQSAHGDLTSRIARADLWLERHRDDSRLLLALGRMCLAQRLWGKAQNYLEASLSMADHRDARLELARLLEQTDRADEATQHYRAAAAKSAGSTVAAR